MLGQMMVYKMAYLKGKRREYSMVMTLGLMMGSQTEQLKGSELVHMTD